MSYEKSKVTLQSFISFASSFCEPDPISEKDIGGICKRRKQGPSTEVLSPRLAEAKIR
ncbi:hypothetical protein RMSM_02212 [Rhodopirellula maiorica SM1]|uniref:Uncharacterized protein n=1 Tax=Rhodopirellula maiorica SM1 TaxID=1265738 RepID=M5RNF7_9BACT|nr:hypothetical protein RMSM_02212 [Rhodopirellula maiorica SM1]